MNFNDLKQMNIPDDAAIEVNSVWSEAFQDLTPVSCDGFYDPKRNTLFLTPEAISLGATDFDSGYGSGYDACIDDFMNAVKEKFPTDKNAITKLEIIASHLRSSNVVKKTSSSRINEIQSVKSLCEKIGYGNVMDIASGLWALKSGATMHVPTVIPYLTKAGRKVAESNLDFRIQELKSLSSEIGITQK